MKIKVDPRKIKNLPDWIQFDLDEATELRENGMSEEAKELVNKIRQAIIIKGVKE